MQVGLFSGAAQSTLQDIKVPEYGGGYAFSPVCPATRNRYLFWSVLCCHAKVILIMVRLLVMYVIFIWESK